MTPGNIVHVVGVGTIGEPLTGLLLQYRKELGIDEVSFYKHSPRLEDRPMIVALQRKGGKLAVAPEKKADFEKLGLHVAFTAEEAMKRASVIVDATPEDSGLENKEKHYTKLKDVKGFLAQGSEDGFGKQYAYGVNDKAITNADRFIHVVSCNTHNISVILKTLAFEGELSNLKAGRFICIRRSSDIGESKLSASPTLDKHKEAEGTHHAHDVANVFKTLGKDLNLWSSALKTNTQYMHTLWFNLELSEPITKEEAIRRIQANPLIAVTNKQSANEVFAWGRDQGPYGRILSQAVLSLPTLAVRGNEVFGFCFTPQDGNVLLSNIAAVTRLLHPEEWEKRMRAFDALIVKEI
ncbi:MAG: hypothetical protein HY556_11085 [Euryarchaeota archaeon]|nr:hypothetical protein [Euryarchaeota archaeon]